MPEKLLSEKQVEFITEGPEGFASKNHWNYRDKIKKNLNAGVPQILGLFPDLVPYIDTETLQADVNGTDIGLALGQLLTPVQRREVAAMLIWGDQHLEESNTDFLTRLPTLIEDYKAQYEAGLDRLRQSGETVQFIRKIATRFQTHLTDHIESERTNRDVTIAVPNDQVIDWLKTQQNPDDRPQLPELVAELYGSWSDGPEGKLIACRDILISLGMHNGVESTRSEPVDSIEEKWRIDVPPTDADTAQYLAVIDALDSDIEARVIDYFVTHSIEKKDRLLIEATGEIDRLDRPGRDILEWDTPDSNIPEWKGHHTHRANHWTNERDPPLLSKSPDGKWEWTKFGKLVRYLYAQEIDCETLETNGIPDDITDALASVVNSSK